jgi:hypothetical protein
MVSFLFLLSKRLLINTNSRRIIKAGRTNLIIFLRPTRGERKAKATAVPTTFKRIGFLKNLTSTFSSKDLNVCDYIKLLKKGVKKCAI